VCVCVCVCECVCVCVCHSEGLSQVCRALEYCCMRPVCCRELKCVAARCSVLQCVAVCFSVLQSHV